MTIRVIEQALEGYGGGRVRVRRNYAEMASGAKSESVQVFWFCGQSRTFSCNGIRDVIDYIDRMKAHPDVWLQTKDTHGARFYTRLEDDDLYADDGPSSSARCASWAELKRALRKAVE